MSKIRILPEQLANQIAAGEVVERPASVVKELLENSLDAGASRIEIEIEGGGTRLIRIIDDGEGMNEDDILLCLERHGTSKISVAHDLDSISTLGFRGEAIPSIGSVSKMVIISRPEKAHLGTKVVFDYGTLLKVHEFGCSQGTIFEVRNLFGMTPARRKFLRTVRTELGHIEEIVKNYALGAPTVSCILRVNGKKNLHLDNNHSLNQRLAHIIHYKSDFIEVGSPLNKSTTTGIHGLLVPPETQLSSSAKLRLFVNGRAIKDRMMAHAVNEGLRGFLMKGRFPGGYLHLWQPEDQIDVNVHPAKHEIRFRNSRDVHELITQAIQAAIAGYQKDLQSSLFHPPSFEPSFIEEPQRNNSPPLSPTPLSELPQSSFSQRVAKNEQSHTPAPLFSYSPPQGLRTEEPSPPPEKQPETTNRHTQEDPPTASFDEHGLQVIGQFQNLYIFCQSTDGLVIIDQHAAHERLLYEKFRRQYTTGKVTSQILLFPETVELTLFQIQLVEKNQEEIAKMGFTLKEFGGNSYIISAVPALAGQAHPGQLFMDLLETFGSERENSSGSHRLDNILATMACKAAVKSGDRLNPQEIDALLTNMTQANLFSHCPHGRPVIKHFSTKDIKKWFYRT